MPLLTSPGARRHIAAALLIACAGLAFLPSLRAYFLSDDFVLLSWTRVSSAGDVLTFFDPGTEWFYRPLVKVYYWLGQSAFGLSAAPLHVVSIALHLLNALLIYLLASRYGKLPWGASLLASLAFLLDPHHAETVSWIAATGDLMGGAAVLGSLLLFARYLEGGSSAWPLVASLALFAVGLLARETVMALPALLVLYALTFGVSGAEAAGGMRSGTRSPIRLDRRMLAPLGYIVLALAYFALVSIGRGGGEGSLGRGGLQFRSLNLDSILLGVLDYVHGLVPGGSLLTGQPLDVLRWVVWVEAALLLAAAWVLWRWGRRIALFGLGWVLVTPLVFVFFSGPTDRYFYLPSMGFALVAGDIAAGVVGGRRTKDEGRRLERRARERLASSRSSYARWGVALVAALYIAAQGAQVAARTSLWAEAGQVTGGVLHDLRTAVPEPLDGAPVFLAGIPLHIKGVPAFDNGLPEAVQLAYSDPTLRVLPVTCETVGAWSLKDEDLLFRYKPNGVERITPGEMCP